MATPSTEASGTKLYALIDYEDAYVQPLILSALQARLPSSSYTLVKSLSECPAGAPLLQFCAYEGLDFERNNSLANAYVIRKALIRKHYLSNTVSTWITKNPQSVLKDHVKPAVDFELDYAEFLDDALVEAFELHDSFEKNLTKSGSQRDWWILKPGMSDRGQGIRLFSTEDELRTIFEEWEEEQEESEPEEDDHDVPSGSEDHRKPLSRRQSVASSGGGLGDARKKDYIITSQLRHFIAQPYIHPPLLISPTTTDTSSTPRKFHIRTYVLAAGALQVYVFKPMLALFAAKPYSPPWLAGDIDDLRAHLTNTCLQDSNDREGSVLSFWSLPDDLSSSSSSATSSSASQTTDWKASVFGQICQITGQLFEAAARGQTIHFQSHPNAFELFGLDFLIDESLKTYLLEVNAFPDFRQTGDELKNLVQELMEDVFDVAVKPYFNLGEEGKAGTERLKLVLDIDLGRK